jgi:hypothetical protein
MIVSRGVREMTRAAVERAELPEGPAPGKRGNRVRSAAAGRFCSRDATEESRMKAGYLARIALLIAAVAFFLTGCGGGASYPKSPGRGRAMGPNDSRLSMEAGVKKEPPRDSDGIPDQADVMPAAEPASGERNELAAPAPAPPPPPPPPGEKRPDVAKDPPRAEGTEAPHETSMLIYTARVTMAVYQVDQGVAAVEKIARDNGGYLAVKKDKEITIRIPRNRFDPALAQIDKIGDVLHRDVQALDVTDEFVDTEIRIKNGRAMQARLKILLDKANVKEALEIEKEMRRVTEELELLEGKLKLLKDKIAYSTITVAFEARGSAIQSTKIKLPFPWLTRLGLPTLLQLSEDR